MPLFAATYTYLPDCAEQREANKPAHRQWLLEQVDAGRILSVGPFTDGSGALLIVSANSASDAQELLARDPHNLQMFIDNTHIRPWQPVFGHFS